MFNKFTLLVLMSSLAFFIQGAAAGQTRSKPIVKKTLIGYNGFNGDIREKVIPSGGGELGKVFYVTDSVDLARDFARVATGPNAKPSYICEVYAHKDKWMAQAKTWIDPEQHRGIKAIAGAYPGTVLFATHALPMFKDENAVKAVNQLGIREEEIASLEVEAQCYPRQMWDGNHVTMDYPSLIDAWHIHDTRVAHIISESWDNLRAVFRWNRI